MEVDLSAFFSPRGTLICPDRAELAVARAFAAAANASHGAHQHIATPECVAVTFRVSLADGTSWGRQLKDVMLRCVDRAMGRVCPPLDVLQYLGDSSPTFVATAEAPAEQVVLRVVFNVRPSTALLPSSLLKPHTVEGEVVEGVLLPEPEDVAAITAAASETRKDNLSDMELWYRARAAHQQYDSSIPLDSIQRLAGSLLGVEGEAEEDHDGALMQARQKHQEDKLEQLQWQLARWLAELFLNEGGWARPRGSSSANNSSSNVKHNTAGGSAAHARGTSDAAAAAARRLFQGPLRPAFPHVVEAALFAHPPRPLLSSPSADPFAASEAASRRQLHADVRGMEWDGLLLGYTARYAYVAVPYFVSAAETTTRVTASSSSSSSNGSTCVWSIVSRLPIPAFVREQQPRVRAEGANSELPGSHHKNTTTTATTRKRTRLAAADEADTLSADTHGKESTTLAQAVLSRCFNVEEAMRHDTSSASVFRLTEVPFLVTVRAHRVYCARADASKQPQLPAASARATSVCAKKPHPAASPYKLSMVLEDAYAVAHRRLDDEASASMASQRHWAADLFGIEVRGSEDSPDVSAFARSLHTFPDVVSVVRESCHRFTRSHERFCAVHKRCLEVKKQSAPSTQVGRQHSKEDEHKSNAVPHKDEGEETRERDDLPSQAVAAQQLRLLHRAEDVYASIADSMSVHYKKLRGAARVSVPVVRTSADVPALEEGNNVEFKAKVGLSVAGHDAAAAAAAVAAKGRARQASTMDTERLRNTIAAMAACRGGVVLIGVADDGRILGHSAQLAVSRHLRTSGFCPAMVKDAVQVKELRWRAASAMATPGAAVGVGDDGGRSTDAPAKRSMPENWWKAGSAAGMSSADAKAGLDKAAGHGKHAVSAAAEQQVITVITVEKGQAPFYATAKNAPPYQRGCASTVVMPTVVLARRLMKELV